MTSAPRSAPPVLMTPECRPVALVYIIGTYPLLTTTFIDREITSMRRWGADLDVVAVRRPPAAIPLSEDQRKLQEGVTYLLPIRWRALVLSHLYFSLLHPGRFLGALVYLFARPHPTLRARLKTLLHFGEGVYAAFLVRRKRFDEFHAHFLDRAATMALVAGRLLARPYSLSVHAGADVFVEPVLLREKIAAARHVATCTSYNREYISSLTDAEVSHKISHINHGLDLSAYRPPSLRETDPPLVLAVAQLAQRKGLARLVRACNALRAGGTRFRCEIVGEGPQRAELEGLIAELELTDVVLLRGALPHESVMDLYRRASAFVLPCIRTPLGDVDGIPNVLAEAMAMKVPVVSTDLPAIRELVVDGYNGILVPPDDDDELVSAISRILHRPSVQQRLRERGRKTVEEAFDVEANVWKFATTMWPDKFPSNRNGESW